MAHPEGSSQHLTVTWTPPRCSGRLRGMQHQMESVFLTDGVLFQRNKSFFQETFTTYIKLTFQAEEIMFPDKKKKTAEHIPVSEYVLSERTRGSQCPNMSCQKGSQKMHRKWVKLLLLSWGSPAKTNSRMENIITFTYSPCFCFNSTTFVE